MALTIAALPGNETLAARLATLLNAELIALEVHQFPDEETLIRIPTSVAGQELALVCSLDRPNGKFLPLIFASAAAKNSGATRVGLIAPYLAYMRQDTQFHPGEVISAKAFAAALSRSIDWLITIDPHLHRIHSLGDIFGIPAKALHAALPLAEWISREVANPILIGPDEESAQWVSDVAKRIGCPFMMLRKIRHGDTDIEIAPLDASAIGGRTPVVIDDIISTGETMAQTVRRLVAMKPRPPICVGVHAIFAGEAYSSLTAAGASRVVTANTVNHPSNGIDVAPLLAQGVRDILANSAGSASP